MLRSSTGSVQGHLKMNILGEKKRVIRVVFRTRQCTCVQHLEVQKSAKVDKMVLLVILANLERT